MRQTLRPYQAAQAGAVLAALDAGVRRVLYTAATGTGKTTTMAELVRVLLGRGEQVLILSHRREIITQTCERVRAHCGLEPWEIGIELAESRAHSACRVIVGSVQTCMRQDRPAGWKPSVIIVDEAHHAAARAQYQNTFQRFAVPDACALIGCTATPKRTDRRSLYAENPDGSPVLIEDRQGRPRPAGRDESAFDRLVHDYSILDAVEDGWLVPVRGIAVSTDVSLDGVGRGADGDFARGELAARVDQAERTCRAISAWKEAASDRQTLVFCASVEHAHHAAQLWRDAGFSAAAVDGQTDSWTRHRVFEDFKSGAIQVLCNMQIATEGTDLVACSCIMHLRPTKSWNLYVQMTGRALRPLAGIVDGLPSAEERLAAIAGSAKPDALVLDVVDNYSRCGELCTVPSILDLPVELDLEGHSLTEAREMLREFEEVRKAVIGECPMTYSELAARLRAVDIMRRSGAETVRDWRATPEGYRLVRIRPGCQADLVPNGDGWRLIVTWQGRPILEKNGRPGGDMRAYLDAAARHARAAVDAHARSLPPKPRGTLERLTERQVRCLRANGHSLVSIECMAYARARALIRKYMEQWRARCAMEERR